MCAETDRQLVRLEGRLTTEVARLEVKVADVKTSITYTVWLAMATLAGLVVVLEHWLA